MWDVCRVLWLTPACVCADLRVTATQLGALQTLLQQRVVELTGTRLYSSRTLPHNTTVLHQAMLWTRVSWRRRSNLPQYWEQRVRITESWQIMLQDTQSRSSRSMNWPSGQLGGIAQACTCTHWALPQTRQTPAQHMHTLSITINTTNTCTAHAHTEHYH